MEKNFIDRRGGIDNKYEKLKGFSYDSVVVGDCPLKEELSKIGEFYLAIRVNDAFYEMRKKAGVDVRDGKTLAAGESWFYEGGIVLGQWLQAYSRLYAMTGDERYRLRVTEYVDAFAEVAAVQPDCVICVNTYAAEKIFDGLMDAQLYCGCSKAYSVCRGLVNQFMNRPDIQNARLRLGDNGGSPDETACEIEWYTVSKSLYRFLESAENAGEEEEYIRKIQTFAEKFRYFRFWDIFKEGRDVFRYSPTAGQNTAYFHAYSHLNSFNSAAYIYECTGDRYYLDAALGFNCFLRNSQLLVTGGFGAYLEWFMPQTGIIYALRYHHNNFETQCNSYASFCFDAFLTRATGRLEYGDLTELLIYNAILASLPTDESGHAFYYSDYSVQGGEKQLHPATWTCCSGTRPLALLEIVRNIYFTDEKGAIYVNLFFNSQVTHDGVTVTQQTQFPESEQVKFKVTADKKREIVLYIRKPSYLTGKASFEGDGQIKATELDGQYRVELTCDGTCEFTLTLPMAVKEYDIAECGEGVRAYRYGPIALAAEGIPAMPALTGAELVRDGLGLRFKCGGMTFRPFSEYRKGEKYKMYFEL